MPAPLQCEWQKRKVLTYPKFLHQATGSRVKMWNGLLNHRIIQDVSIVPATPAARRVAHESGIALETVAGSGPRGRVQAADILAAANSTPSSTTPINGREAEIIPLTSIRRTIAERLQKSFQESPHIALTVEVDMTEMESTRKRFNEQAEKSGQSRITVTALIIKIVAWALEKNPYINSSFNGDSISLWKDVNIGVATAVPQGLVVPVIKGANHLGVSEINAQLITLAERARDNKLKLDDVQGGTFTISNLGMFGIHQFRAVINPPESAILAVGSTVRRPVVVDDQDRVEVRPMVSLTSLRIIESLMVSLRRVSFQIWWQVLNHRACFCFSSLCICTSCCPCLGRVKNSAANYTKEQVNCYG
jgi:pyruvate/2-oxoglutarate dehydrogenase complex dihydrolipoamide acyltransferase (E2) component